LLLLVQQYDTYYAVSQQGGLFVAVPQKSPVCYGLHTNKDFRMQFAIAGISTLFILGYLVYTLIYPEDF
jgi:hypothetical protein